MSLVLVADVGFAIRCDSGGCGICGLPSDRPAGAADNAMLAGFSRLGRTWRCHGHKYLHKATDARCAACLGVTVLLSPLRCADCGTKRGE